MQPPDKLRRRIDEVHRAEWGRSVAGLFRLSGDLHLAEDCVQEAFVIAVDAWNKSGIPDNPGAWIRTVARRRLIDFARRRRTQDSGAAQFLIDAELDSAAQREDSEFVDSAINDDELALIFLCCHPAISPTDQVMLTLRIVAGILSDKIGRSYTLIIMLVFQAILMFISIPVVGAENASAILLVLIATFIGFNYGTNLSLFPSFAKDLWGLKNFGSNYGLLFTAWGVGGFVMGRMSQMLKASTDTYNSSFITAGVLLIIGAVLAAILKARSEAQRVPLTQAA